jgi:aspartate/methionine/tyrosine aminotransferase
MSSLDFSRRGEALIGQEMFHILARANELERNGEKVYHLELGEPKSYAPGRIVNKTISSLLDYKLGYAPSAGLFELREAISSYFSNKLKKKIEVENVVISPANLLIFQFLDVVCEVTDIVSMFTPTFPTYLAACKYIGVKSKMVSLSAENGFQLTKMNVDEAFSVKPKVIMVNSANNPTGAVYDEEVLAYLLEKAKSYDCWIFSDETYGMLSYNKPFFSMLNFNYEKLITISSFSKIFSVPGYRIGYSLADPRVTEKLALSSSTLYSCLPIFTQEGIIIGAPVIDQYTKNRRTYYKKLSKVCKSIIDKAEILPCSMPDAAFYLFIDIRKFKLDDVAFCSQLLNQFKTALTPGSSFGHKGFVRASICGDGKDVKKGLRQLVLFAKSITNI